MNPDRALRWAVAVFGALLAFSLEPLVGRLVTLSFGGAVHVWAVCVLVFQTLLLLSTAWAELARRWPLAHLLPVLAGLAVLPIDVVATPDPAGAVLPLALTVLFAVGPPFFALASASVLAQAWAARDGDPAPWGLYAAGSAGSLVGLFAYPLLIEPLVGLGAQRAVWSGAYVVWGVLAGLAAARASRTPLAPSQGSAWPSARQGLVWVLLSGSASILLLALTGWIGTEFGSFPLLWTIPLGLYLGSFVLAFSERVPVGWLRPFWPDLLLAFGFFASLAGEPALHLPLYAAFAGLCWLVHAALYRSRPAVGGLTAYYLAISLGGWLGGCFVTLLAPAIFPGLWELPIGIAACGLALLASGETPDRGWFQRVHWRFGFSRVALLGTVAFLQVRWWNLQVERNTIASYRSLYGVFHVRERDVDGARARSLLHGATSHGSQYLAPDPRSRTPMSYYHPAGGNAQALGLRSGPRLAGIGLGTGAIAGLLATGEQLVFYELDPNAEIIARRWFSYLADSPGEVSVRVGDARLVLDGESSTYDAILVDAFAGDGIPTHLLTVEAFQVYLDHLAPDGVLVLHISNRFLDLRGVVKAAGDSLGLHGAIRFETPDAPAVDDPLYGPAVTVVFSRSADRLTGLSDPWTSFGPGDGLPAHAAWTDDHVDLLQPLGLR